MTHVASSVCAGACYDIGGPLPCCGGLALTNTIAFWIVLILVAAMIADFALNSGAAVQFLARKFLDLVEWVDFWN
jgi:hypothetical protein